MKMSWNYRVCTKIEKEERIFVVLPCYYDEGGTAPHSWGDQKQICTAESIEDLKWDYEKALEAFNKPIIDLDNFPNEYLVKSPFDASIKLYELWECKGIYFSTRLFNILNNPHGLKTLGISIKDVTMKELRNRLDKKTFLSFRNVGPTTLQNINKLFNLCGLPSL